MVPDLCLRACSKELAPAFDQLDNTDR